MTADRQTVQNDTTLPAANEGAEGDKTPGASGVAALDRAFSILFAFRPGDSALYDAARPFSLEFGERYRGLTLKVPRAVLSARLPDIEKLMALRLSGESKLGALANTAGE